MITSLPRKFFNFLRSAFRELKFVNFPSRQATWKLGNIVILMSAVFATALYLTDWLFQVIRNLITSIKL